MSAENGSAPIARATGLLIIEVVNSNPNGDPDRESDPRQRPDGRGEISPPSFKRKIRDLVEVKEGPVWLAIAGDLNLDGERFAILESRGRDRPKIEAEIREDRFAGKYWDARVFGNTFLEKRKETKENGDAGGEVSAAGTSRARSKSGKKLGDADLKLLNSIKTGVVQFGLGLSIAPIAVERMTNTNKAGVEVDKDRGMAPLGYRIVQHGVYCMPFFVNPTAAVKSGCTAADIELLYRLIPLAYTHTASYVRPLVGIRHAWVIEHKNALGSCSDFALLDALRPRKKQQPGQPSNSWDDYDVPATLPEELAAKVKPIRDLVEEFENGPNSSTTGS